LFLSNLYKSNKGVKHGRFLNLFPKKPESNLNDIKFSRTGKVIFSLEELPIDSTIFFTERNNSLERVSETEVLIAGSTKITIPTKSKSFFSKFQPFSSSSESKDKSSRPKSMNGKLEVDGNDAKVATDKTKTGIAATITRTKDNKLVQLAATKKSIQKSVRETNKSIQKNVGKMVTKAATNIVKQSALSALKGGIMS